MSDGHAALAVTMFACGLIIGVLISGIYFLFTTEGKP